MGRATGGNGGDAGLPGIQKLEKGTLAEVHVCVGNACPYSAGIHGDQSSACVGTRQGVMVWGGICCSRLAIPQGD